jgi:hypothetical protein
LNAPKARSEGEGDERRRFSIRCFGDWLVERTQHSELGLFWNATGSRLL